MSPALPLQFKIQKSPTLLQKTTYEYDPLGRYTLIKVNDVPKIWYNYVLRAELIPYEIAELRS